MSRLANQLLRTFRKGTPLHHQRLIFLNTQLEDSKSISDYIIEEGDMIHLTLQLRGGGMFDKTVIFRFA